MTRCYGWSLKYTSLVPFADGLNHNIDAVEHFVIDPKLEQNPVQGYNNKINKMNLDLISLVGNKEFHNWRL